MYSALIVILCVDPLSEKCTFFLGLKFRYFESKYRDMRITIVLGFRQDMWYAQIRLYQMRAILCYCQSIIILIDYADTQMIVSLSKSKSL